MPDPTDSTLTLKLTGSRIDKPDVPTGWSAPTAVSDIDLTVQPGQILVLELPDGTTLITSGKRLKKG